MEEPSEDALAYHDHVVGDGDLWPKTVEEAADYVIKQFDDVEESYIKSLGKKDDMIQFHFNLGMTIRNWFGLWQGNDELIEDCAKAGMHADIGEERHPDTCSGVIMERVWEKLHGQA